MLVNDVEAGKQALIDCTNDIELWCRSYGLKLNADKSDVIWLGSRKQLAKVSQTDKEFTCRAAHCEPQSKANSAFHPSGVGK